MATKATPVTRFPEPSQAETEFSLVDLRCKRILCCSSDKKKLSDLVSLFVIRRDGRLEDYGLQAAAPAQITEEIFREARNMLQMDEDFRYVNVKISPREVDVLRCVQRGMSNKEIANELGKAERTVKFHVSSLLLKFNVNTRVRLVNFSRDEVREVKAATKE